CSKRVITIKKVQGDHAGMIATLTGYLDTYYNDTEAWLELWSAYLAQHHYQQAAFCMEELLLLQTANHFWHLKYAEILWIRPQYRRQGPPSFQGDRSEERRVGKRVES